MSGGFVMTRPEYSTYLRSDRWKATRARITARARAKARCNSCGHEFCAQDSRICSGGRAPLSTVEERITCEECGNRAAKVVHHLTYEHVGDERDHELVAICRWCHRKHHPDMPLRERR